jgi:3-dehydroquinate dehydratase-2
VELFTVQSNGEQGLLDALHEEAGNVDGVVVNPGALAPIAFALAEGLSQIGLPVIEVLIKPLPPERGVSSLTGVAKHQLHALGIEGYVKALELLVPEGKTKNPVVEEEEEPEEEVQVRSGKSIGRKRPVTKSTPAVVAKSGKTIGRGKPAEKQTEKTKGASPSSGAVLTRKQVHDRIKKRLKNEETAESLAKWARDTWTGIQRGAACEAGAKETIENVLLTLMAGAKASDQILVSQMAKLQP